MISISEPVRTLLFGFNGNRRESLSERPAPRFDQVWIDEMMKVLAFRLWGKAEDVGRTAVFLAFGDAAYITGQQFNVSGGYGI